MAKKIRFPLEMDNGLEVRSMEELRNNFSLGRVLEYIQNGKLVIWLGIGMKIILPMRLRI